MSVLITNEIIFNYVKANPGRTSKEIAEYFNTKSALLNKMYSDKHGFIYDKTWSGIYSIRGIGHCEYMHYVEEGSTYEKDEGLNPNSNPNTKDETVLINKYDVLISAMNEKVDTLNIILLNLNETCLKYKNLQDSFKTMETHLSHCEKSLDTYKKEHFTNWKNMLFYVSFNWTLILILIIIGLNYLNLKSEVHNTLALL